jgi:hypothetical protein
VEKNQTPSKTTNMKHLAAIILGISAICLTSCNRPSQLKPGTTESQVLGYWIKPNGISEWQGSMNGEQLLLRLDSDGYAHVIKRGMYSDQFADTFMGVLNKNHGTSFVYYDHGEWAITQDKSGPRLLFNFYGQRILFSILSADSNSINLKATQSAHREFTLHRPLQKDVDQLKKNSYYLPKFQEADQFEPGDYKPGQPVGGKATKPLS